MRSLIRRRVDLAEIQEHAVANGMTTELHDGIAKFRAGVTSIEEFLRATT